MFHYNNKYISSKYQTYQTMEMLQKTTLFDAQLYETLNPAQHKNDLKNMSQNWELRYALLKKFGVWNYPTEHVIVQLKAFIGDNECLEIGAGSGLWSMMLKDLGVNIVATDSCDEIKTKTPVFTDIYKMDADCAVEHFTNANVLLSVWPRGFLKSALEKFKGEYFIFVGEIDGCTGYIHTNDEDCCFEELMVIDGYVPFIGIRDSVIVYARK